MLCTTRRLLIPPPFPPIQSLVIDGYVVFAVWLCQVIAEFNGRLSFTCVEMRDCEHPPEGRCSPQGLLQQVLECSERYGVPLAGENALQRYDEHAFDRIAESAFGRTARAGRLEQLTFLRMGDLMFDNWDAFCAFLRRMRMNRPDQLDVVQQQLMQQAIWQHHLQQQQLQHQQLLQKQQLAAGLQHTPGSLPQQLELQPLAAVAAHQQPAIAGRQPPSSHVEAVP